MAVAFTAAQPQRCLELTGNMYSIKYTEKPYLCTYLGRYSHFHPPHIYIQYIQYIHTYTLIYINADLCREKHQ